MCHIRHLGYADLDTDERRALTGAVPGVIDDDSREPFHPRTARALEMGGGHVFLHVLFIKTFGILILY